MVSSHNASSELVKPVDDNSAELASNCDLQQIWDHMGPLGLRRTSKNIFPRSGDIKNPQRIPTPLANWSMNPGLILFSSKLAGGWRSALIAALAFVRSGGCSGPFWDWPIESNHGQKRIPSPMVFRN